SAFPSRRWLRVTVLPGCAGCRTLAVPASWTVRDVKRRLAAETGFPLSDWIKIGDLTSQNCHLFVNLQSKGLKGGGRFGQTTPPLVDFLKDILRRYPEGGQILKVGQGCMRVHLHARNREMRQITRKFCLCLHFKALSRFEWLYLFPSAPAMQTLNRTA
uniref:Sacsin molecular chaperone n=1 Tax=Moschus moschiferus TaxID=68415 RepID=A0A8C6CZX1_MOSMO